VIWIGWAGAILFAGAVVSIGRDWRQRPLMGMLRLVLVMGGGMVLMRVLRNSKIIGLMVGFVLLLIVIRRGFRRFMR
jgi:hypothetical protein